MTTQLIPHEFSGKTILQRESDGFINATAMCKASGKRWPDYHRLDTTKAFIKALIPVVQIPTTEQNQGVIQTAQGGKPNEQGTWVHPDIAIHLAQWLSPQFAVQVSRWVREWMATGQNPVPQTQLSLAIKEQVECQLLIANAAADMLRMDDSSRLKMLHQINQEHGLPNRFLPDYAEGQPTQSLTALLKEQGKPISTREANERLITLGLLQIQTRASTKDPSKEKTFKSLTEAGLNYGKNLVSPHNPRETQPHFYRDTFPELLQHLMEVAQ